MNWKWKRKWLISLAVTCSMVISSVGTAAATEPAGPTVTMDTGSVTGLDTEEKDESDTREANAPDAGEAADPDSGEMTDPDTGEANDSDIGEAADPDSGEVTDPDTGEANDSDTGEAADPNDGEAADPDTGEADAPDSGETSDPDDGEAADPDTGEAEAPDSGETSDPDDGEATDPDTGAAEAPDSGEAADPDDGEATDPDAGAAEAPDNGEIADPDAGDTDIPDNGEAADPDTGEGDDLPGDSDGELSADPENPDGKPSADLTPDTHQHSWSVEWSYDEIGHWHECDGEDCPITDSSEMDGYAQHTYGEDNVCTQCGYFEPVNQLARAAAGDIPTYQEAYEEMVALKEEYPEGMIWTNFTPYGSDGPLGDAYVWKGGKIYGASSGVGCMAFAFILSDAAFGSLPARAVTKGSFTFDDVKVGDILRVRNNSHSVIVLQKSAAGVVIAEANYNKTVHWGRVMSKSEVLAADFIITRYPKGYAPLDDPDDEELVQDGTVGSLNWTLTNAGVLTISGKGAIPDFSAGDPLPWDEYSADVIINTIIIEKGVTGIGDYAFCGSEALSVYIPDGVTNIGEGAFKGSSLISVTIPGTVVDIGNNAFHDCANLTSVTVSEGVETIGDNAFRGCTTLAYIDFPASITSVGAGAFMSCEKMKSVRFMPGSGTVTLGDGLFAECWGLTSVTLPQTADRISNEMFSSCTSLPSLYIPASVKEIGENPFTSCIHLKYIYFGGSEAEWKAISNVYLEASLKSTGTTVVYNAEFDDPFASDPNDPGDFKPDEGVTDPSDPDDGNDNNDPDDSENTHKHSWSAAWSHDETSHWHECVAGCSVTDNRKKDGYGAHTYGGWIIDVNATASRSGSRHRDCTVCQYRQTERIPATGSSGGSSGGSDSSGSSSDSSGSSSGSSSDSSGSSSASDTTVSTTVEHLPDGSSITTMTQKDGTVATVTTDAAGRVETKVNVSASAVTTARQSGGAVSLPVPAVPAVRDVASAPAITVYTGNEAVKVAIPVVTPTAGTVAVIIHEDGTTEVVKASVPTTDTVVTPLPDGATVKIVDNSRSFQDVPVGSQFEDAITFVSARDLFYGTTATAFAPQEPMTYAMVMTALARFDGAETGGGITWYEKSMEWAKARGISNGASLDSNIVCEELITVLWKYMGSPVSVAGPAGYVYTGQTSDSQAAAAMGWAMKNGIVSGFENGSPDPQGQITRAQAAQIIMNLVKTVTLNPVK